MTEVEIIDKINRKRGELEKQKAQKADSAVIKGLEKEIEDLTINLSLVDHGRDQKAFLDECAG